MVFAMVFYFVILGVINLILSSKVPIDKNARSVSQEEKIPVRIFLDRVVILIFIVMLVSVYIFDLSASIYIFMFFISFILANGYLCFREWKYSKSSGEYKRYFILFVFSIIYTILVYFLIY